MKRLSQKLIELGDVVSLVSGGPRMTVGRLLDHHFPADGLPSSAVPYALCIWFDAEGKEKSGEFPVVALKKVNEPSPVKTKFRR